MEIGNNIQKLRKERNITQEQLAEKLNVTRQTISKWELGETYPDIDQSKRLSKIFKVSLDELTNNDTKDIIIAKVMNTEKLTKIIISILKIVLLIIVSLIIILVSIIFFKEYFDVKPVSQMQSIECIINNKHYSYEVYMNNETSYHIDKLITNDTEIEIDPKNYINFEDIFHDIKENVLSRNGSCN